MALWKIYTKFAADLTIDMSGTEQIRNMIKSCPRGSIFFPEDFSFVGSVKLVNTALTRISDEGMIVRLAPGIYCYPKIDDKYGMGQLMPSIDEIAHAISKRDKSRIVPTGTYALNILGLSTQLQTNVVYYTDGSPRRINVGNGRGILFKRSSEMKRFAYKSELMQLIVSALREIGNGKITENELDIIANRLKEVGDVDFNNDIALAPAWVQKLLKEIR